MMIRCLWHVAAGLAAGLIIAPAHAQAIVESAVLGAAAGTAAPGIKGTGSSAGGVFDALRKTLDGAKQPASAAGKAGAQEARASASGTVIKLEPPSAEALAAVQPKDVSGIKIGLTREELIERFGQPALRTSEPGEGGPVETYTYMRSKSDAVVVTLRGGVVTHKAEPPKRNQAAVITLE